MKTSAKLMLAASALTITGSLGVGAVAQATTEHCDAGLGKIEIGAGPSISTSLPDGTPVCIKAGTKTYYTEVIDGKITNDYIKNRPGNAYLGISYYVWYECEDSNGYECGGGGGSIS